MQNRQQFDHSFRINRSIPKVNKTPVRRRSCECLECGVGNKKMHYIGSILQSFLPYQNIAYKLFESEKKIQEKRTKIQQQQQLRLRNKRHVHNKDMLKKAVNANSFHDSILKRKPVELPPLNICSLKDIHSKPALSSLQVLPQRKLWDKRQTTIKFLYASYSGHSQRCYLPATPLDPFLAAKINKVIYQSYHLRHQQGTIDDFNQKLRLNIHEDKPETQSTKHHFLAPPIRQEEDFDEEESMVESVQHMPIKKVNREEPYKEILKYNKRSFANLIEQSSLTERKVIQNLIKASYSMKVMPNTHDSQQMLSICMVNSNCLDVKKSAKRKNSIRLLHPIERSCPIKAQSQHIRISTQSKHKKNQTAVSILFRA